MSASPTLFLLLAITFHGVRSLDRNTINEEYQPILQNRTDKITLEYTQANARFTIVKNEVSTNTIEAMTVGTAEITRLKAIIANATVQAADSPVALNCVKAQQTKANQLAVASFNITCLVPERFTELSSAVTNFRSLATLANTTISLCNQLNILVPMQDQGYLDCIVNKLLDIDTQDAALTKNFENARNTTLSRSNACLTNESNILMQSINEIMYQVAICLSSMF